MKELSRDTRELDVTGLAIVALGRTRTRARYLQSAVNGDHYVCKDRPWLYEDLRLLLALAWLARKFDVGAIRGEGKPGIVTLWLNSVLPVDVRLDKTSVSN